MSNSRAETQAVWGSIPFFLTIIHSVAFSYSLIMHESSNHKNSVAGFTMMNLGL
jgi:hypothetical protein